MTLEQTKAKKKEKEETYLKWITCPNCFTMHLHRILKGVKIKEYKKETKCENCGCYLGGN